MSSKSIILFGKGPSVLKCTREIVDQHDEIAICNYPVLNDFFYSLIKDRTINYHFANCGTFDKRYTNEINNKLNIQKIFNTNKPPNNYKKYLNNNARFQNKNLYESIYKNYFDKVYNFKPSTGIYALYYLINTNLYNKITLVGFDNFKLGKKVYYFDILKEGCEEWKRCIKAGNYSPNGKLLTKNEHSPEKTKQYLYDSISKYKNIHFLFITYMKIEKEYANLALL